MNVVIGLDIGGSRTKIVGFRGDERLKECLVKASDPMASAYGGLGKFLNENRLKIADVSSIAMTGVGASYIHEDLLEIPTRRADEFMAVGLGGLYVSDLQEAVVVSMGTGTSIVRCDSKKAEHIIGSGVGGGTLLGLSKEILHTTEFKRISDLAEAGHPSYVDLAIKDLSADSIAGLDPETTASNFGKRSDDASPQDLAFGIVNLVYQSVGTAAVLAARLTQVDQIVFIGSMLNLPVGRNILDRFSKLYQLNIVVPESAQFATAIGAALTGRREQSQK